MMKSEKYHDSHINQMTRLIAQLISRVEETLGCCISQTIGMICECVFAKPPTCGCRLCLHVAAQSQLWKLVALR